MSPRTGPLAGPACALLVLAGLLWTAVVPALTGTGLPAPVAVALVAVTLLAAALVAHGDARRPVVTRRLARPVTSYDARPAAGDRALDPVTHPRRPRAPGSV